MVLEGVLERFPRLRGGCIEQGATWVPGMLDLIDDAQRMFARTEPDLKALPLKASEYVHRQLRFTPLPANPLVSSSNSPVTTSSCSRPTTPIPRRHRPARQVRSHPPGRQRRSTRTLLQRQLRRAHGRTGYGGSRLVIVGPRIGAAPNDESLRRADPYGWSRHGDPVAPTGVAHHTPQEHSACTPTTRRPVGLR